MKIVFLAPFGIRPKGTVIARMIPLAVALQGLGHQVVIVAPPYTNPEDSGKVETIKGVTIRNILLGPQNKVLSAPILAGRMFRAALAEQPDLIHLFKPKGYGGLAAMLLLVLQRSGVKMPPLLVDSDDWEGKGGMNELHSYSVPERFVFRLQENWLLSRAAVTVASRALQTIVESMGVPPEHVLYLPNCVNDNPAGDGAKVRHQLNISIEAPVVLLYTRFFEFNQYKLRFLFTEIFRHVPDVRFLVVGTGRHGEEDLLRVAAAEEGFSSALVIAGWIEPGQIPDFLAAGDVAIYPFSDTLVNRTKCPAKLTELLQAGIAVVADRVGQLAEYIESGVSGELCEPDSWDDMAGKTVALLRDFSRRQNLAENSARRMRERFCWQEHAKNLARFYEQMLRRNVCSAKL